MGRLIPRAPSPSQGGHGGPRRVRHFPQVKVRTALQELGARLEAEPYEPAPVTIDLYRMLRTGVTAALLSGAFAVYYYAWLIDLTAVGPDAVRE